MLPGLRRLRESSLAEKTGGAAAARVRFRSLQTKLIAVSFDPGRPAEPPPP